MKSSQALFALGARQMRRLAKSGHCFADGTPLTVRSKLDNDEGGQFDDDDLNNQNGDDDGDEDDGDEVLIATFSKEHYARRGAARQLNVYSRSKK